MAKKAELLEEAKKLKINVSEKNTISEIEKALSEASPETKTSKREAITAKSGKRSEKGQQESKQKLEKIEKQHHRENEKEENGEKTKVHQKPARPKHDRKGKNYKQAYKKIEKGKEYSVDEAVELIKEVSTTKFDSTIEIHARLNVDPKQADQNIRETLSLPAGTGKKLTIAVFGDTNDVKAAKSAGADIAEEDEFLKRLDKGDLNFDVLISTPKFMSKLGRYAKDLGPRGLMPNPKSGTVTTDIEKAVKEAKAGKIEFRVDSSGIVHAPVGKVSFSSNDIKSNLVAILSSIKSAKPSSIKGSYVKSIYITTTMGPSIRLSDNSI